MSRRASGLLLLSVGLALLAPGSPGRPSPVPTDLSTPAARLRGYLAIDTSNPPGREHAGALYLANLLDEAGIEHDLLLSPEGRANLFARLRTGPGEDRPALVLLHHIDVVQPGPGWSRPPFGGVLDDGRLWGRGAVDAKSLGVAQLEAFLMAANDPRPRRRDLILVAAADEERGGGQGVEFLLDRHHDRFGEVAAVLNEGGNNRQVNGRLHWFGIEVAQKRPLWLRLSATGRGGHAATYNPGNAVHELIRALDRLVDLPMTWRVTDPARHYLNRLADLSPGRWEPLFRSPEKLITPTGPATTLMPGMESLFTDTLQVTRVAGSDQVNVVPAEAVAEIDIRLLPDTDAEGLLERIRATVGSRTRVEVLVTSPPSEPSPVDHPVFQLLEEQLSPEAPTIPYFTPGFTDSRFFRERGIPAYGFSPFALEPQDLRGIHAVDERISVAELDRGIERLRRIVEAWIY